QTEFEQQQKRVKFLGTLLDRSPRNHDRDGSQERGENHEPETDAVESDVVVNLRILDPDTVMHELEAGGIAVKTTNQADRDDKRNERHRHREGADQRGVIARNQKRDKEADQRQDDDDVEQIHRGPPVIPAAIAAISKTDPKTTHVA